MLMVAATTLAPGAALADGIEDDQVAFLYELNLARWDPQSYAEASGVAMDGVLPRPPLAPNSALTLSAGFKANELAESGYFAHQSAVDGKWPNQLAREYGFPLPAEFVDDANNIEALHAGSPVAFDVLESFAKSLSHRVHLFGEGDFFGSHREVGIGRSGTENLWAVHTAYRTTPVTFITGVVFADANGNGKMDPGEGLAGVTVTAGNQSAVSSAGGGYAVRVSAGRVKLGAAGGSFVGNSRTMVTVGEFNIGADFVSGRKVPVVRNYQTCMGLEPTILGTNGNDRLVGTKGHDVIHGLGGNDKIHGVGRGDVICGGDGDDVIFGGSGTDDIFGGDGDDRIWGGTGDDQIWGGNDADILRGEDGSDRIWGGAGLDRLVGGSGTDWVDGGSGIDLCSGGEARSFCE